MQRRSPVVFDACPVRTETRRGWAVVLEYAGQGAGPWLVDLSHRRRWDLQDGRIAEAVPWPVPMPAVPGACAWAQGLLAGRLNRTQALVWHLAGEATADPPDPPCTEVTEAGLLLALIGAASLPIAEKLGRLDLDDPAKPELWLHQGPLCHVPAQVVVWRPKRALPVLLWTCSRGYGRDVARAVLDAGAAFGLHPAGEAVFTDWLAGLGG